MSMTVPILVALVHFLFDKEMLDRVSVEMAEGPEKLHNDI